MASAKLILLTGATGYIGGRLVPQLIEAGHRVRCLARDPDRLAGRDWLPRVETVAGDCLRPETLPAAMRGVDAAFYLVHSMAGGHDFEERDVIAARNFATAARQAGVQRIIYLGGLGDPASGLSDHLRSRQDTGAALRETGVPVTEFRAAVIVGSGSLSFEIIRCLTERVPVMICPKWVYTRVQPIAIRNVLDYLAAALDTPEWLCLDWAWQLRGALDRLLGGVGIRRGRRDPQDVRVGDAVDFWRVEAVEPNRLLRLRAEMKVPGRAWLEFQVEPRYGGGSLLSQTAFFAPRGLAGLLYWYTLYPVHALIFSGLVKRLARNAAG